MTRRSPSRDAAELMAILAEEAASDATLTASSLNRQTAERMFDLLQRTRERLLAHFVGGAADAHELSARAATHALLSLQESVSSIGANLVGHVTLKGKLPSTVLLATELRFSPNVLPGSVVFELSRPTDVENMLQAHEDRPLLDESFDKLFDLLTSVGSAQPNPDEVPAAIRALGPRAAKHIFDLCSVLVDESLGLDFEWVNREGEPKAAKLSNTGARYLQGVAKKNNSATVEVSMAGILLTASVEASQKLRLQAADGTVVPMTASAQIRAGLGEFYNQAVKVLANKTEKVSVTTGRVTTTHALIAIEPLTEDNA